MKKIYCIYGASGHSKVIIEIIEKTEDTVRILYDDDPAKSLLLNYPVTNDNSVFKLEGVSWIIGIGNNNIRKKVAENNLLQYESVFSSQANISCRAHFGKGTVIMPGATLNSSTQVGNHCILNTTSSVDHDCILEDYVHISPNATLCGGVVIGEGSHVGAGAVIIPGVKIGKWATIGAGSVIIKDVPDFSTCVGNPGRLI